MSATAGAATPGGLRGPVLARITLSRLWYTVPDGLPNDPLLATVDFDADVTAGTPRLRIQPGGRVVGLGPGNALNRWFAQLDLAGLAPGDYTAEVLERVGGGGGGEQTVATASFRLSAPEYLVWTLDFEGDASADLEMANTAAIADGMKIPMTVLWNPRAWTSAQVSTARADAMLAWTKGRGQKGDEIGLHLHMWTDYVRAAGITARLSPNWAGRSDGYDVPMTAYPEEEQRALIAYGLKLMADHGLPPSTSFRAGGDFADATTLRALVANGITADCTAVPAGTFGRLRWPWTLAPDAQPYRPAPNDANAVGDLPLLEAPTNAGNTYGYTSFSIVPVQKADLAMLAPAGRVATARRALTVVSHPGTIDATERAAIETLFQGFNGLRYDSDSGPLRFVTLRQLAQAYSKN